jgi:hypothetical protein
VDLESAGAEEWKAGAAHGATATAAAAAGPLRAAAAVSIPSGPPLLACGGGGARQQGRKESDPLSNLSSSVIIHIDRAAHF